MTITELAEHVGMTPRNIRAYQSRGLLDPPRIQGRIAYYSGVHAARLLLVASLQKEGFTLAAVKRLLDNPASYAAIVADRRRRAATGDDDLDATVPVSEEAIRAMFPSAPADLTETGLVWWDGNGGLVSSTVIVAVARTLLNIGVPADLVADLQTEAVRAGRDVGELLRSRLTADTLDDVGRVAVQLSATAFEIGFLGTASAPVPAE